MPPRDKTLRDRANDRGLWLCVGVVAAVKVLVLLVGLEVVWGQQWMAHLTKDVDAWSEFLRACRAGLVPYVDFAKEYPVGAGVVYWALSPWLDPDDLRRTCAVHGAVMSVFDVVGVAVFYRLARAANPARAMLLTLLFGLNLTALVLSPVRFESVVALLALLGYAAHRAGRTQSATLAWSVGSTLKWYPAFFLAAQEWRALVVDRRRWQWLASTTVFLAVTAVVNVPFMVRDHQVTGTLDQWYYPYWFHLHRPLYWDTLFGAGQIWLGPLPIEKSAGTWSLVLMLLAVVVRPRMPLALKSVLICVGALLVNRVYSTQFHLWFYPFLLLGAARAPQPAYRRLLALFAGLDLLNVAVYPFAFTYAYAEMGGFFPLSARQHSGPGTVVFTAAIVLRAVLLGVLAAQVLALPDERETLGTESREGL